MAQKKISLKTKFSPAELQLFSRLRDNASNEMSELEKEALSLTINQHNITSTSISILRLIVQDIIKLCDIKCFDEDTIRKLTIIAEELNEAGDTSGRNYENKHNVDQLVELFKRQSEERNLPFDEAVFRKTFGGRKRGFVMNYSKDNNSLLYLLVPIWIGFCTKFKEKDYVYKLSYSTSGLILQERNLQVAIGQNFFNCLFDELYDEEEQVSAYLKDYRKSYFSEISELRLLLTVMRFYGFTYEGTDYSIMPLREPIIKKAKTKGKMRVNYNSAEKSLLKRYEENLNTPPIGLEKELMDKYGVFSKSPNLFRIIIQDVITLFNYKEFTEDDLVRLQSHLHRQEDIVRRILYPYDRETSVRKVFFVAWMVYCLKYRKDWYIYEFPFEPCGQDEYGNWIITDPTGLESNSTVFQNFAYRNYSLGADLGETRTTLSKYKKVDKYFYECCREAFHKQGKAYTKEAHVRDLGIFELEIFLAIMQNIGFSYYGPDERLVKKFAVDKI